MTTRSTRETREVGEVRGALPADRDRGARAAACFRFDDVVLDVDALELTRAGAVVDVQLKALDVLVYLLRHRHRVVERRELLDALWPGEVVGEASLTQAIKSARRALGDDGAAQRRIRTVRGRGYRFLGEVDEHPASRLDPGPERAPADAEAAIDSPLPEAPLAFLLDRLPVAARSHGGLVAVGGEPGIGKTTLIDRFAAQARAAGALVVRGRALPGGPDYGPWVTLLRDYMRERSASDLSAELGTGARELVRIVPELRERFDGLADPPEVSGVEGQQRVAEAVTECLQRLAAKQTVVAIVEDVHLADPASLRLLLALAVAAEDSPIVVVATHRELAEAPALRELIEELCISRAHTSLVLRGLAREEVAQRIGDALGASPPSVLVDVLFERSDGNPFVVRELLTHWRDAGLVEAAPGTLGGAVALERANIPDGVRPVVAPRFVAVSTECREVLAAASVLARPGLVFEAGLLEEMLAGPETSGRAGRVLESLEEGAANRAIRPVAGAPGRYAFTRALLREVLYWDLAPSRRRALHAAAARGLELTHLHGADPWLAEIALHYFEALPLGDLDKVVAYLLSAADLVRPGDPERASGLLHRGLLALEGTGEAARAQRQAIEARLRAP